MEGGIKGWIRKGIEREVERFFLRGRKIIEKRKIREKNTVVRIGSNLTLTKYSFSFQIIFTEMGWIF